VATLAYRLAKMARVYGEKTIAVKVAQAAAVASPANPFFQD
jgi:hypothetical protein